MTSWIGALALGLAFAAMVMGVYLSFRVLAFPDLTVDGSLPFGASVAGVLIVRGGWDPWATLPFAFLAGGLAGLTTGLLTTRLKINGLLSGILVSAGLWTVNLRVLGDRSNLPLLGVDTVISPFIGTASGLARAIGVNPGEIAAVGTFLAVSTVLGVALTWFLHTELGLAVRATGENEKMIRALGTDTDAMKLLGLALSNGLVGLSGALVSQYQGFVDVASGLGTIVAGLAAVIIGETLVRPRSVGRAVLAAIVGAVLYRAVITAALNLGLGPLDMRLVTSVIVVLALSLPRLRAGLPRGLASRSVAGTVATR